MKAAVTEFGGKEFYMAKASNFIKLDKADISEEMLYVAGVVLFPGDKITLIGKPGRKARTIEMMEGAFLEYRGLYSWDDRTLVIFSVNGDDSHGIYECLHFLDHKQLFTMTNYGQTGTDIQANQIHLVGR